MRPVRELDLSGLRVLDGGMATELEARGCDLSGPLWSGSMIERSPETIADVHRSYLEAGADCLLTAGYQISAEGFQEMGRGAQHAARDAAHALRSAVAIADKVRRDFERAHPRKVWIAASLGPYGAALHNGAEYHGEYAISFEDLVGFHQRRLAALAGTNADFVAFETIPSLEEARAILAALRRFPEMPASVTFICRDARHVAHGESLRDCAQVLDEQSQVVAVGVNCTPPAPIAALIGELATATAKRIAVYPNSGERWDAERRRWEGERDPRAFGEMARLWRAAGAHWIGGCCRTGPDHIRAVAEAWRG